MQTFAALPDEQERTNTVFASHSTKLPWKWRCARDAGTFMRAQSERGCAVGCRESAVVFESKCSKVRKLCADRLSGLISPITRELIASVR